MMFGKSYVLLLMKNTKWNDCGVLVVRIGLTSINIVEVVKRFVAYTQKVIALALGALGGILSELLGNKLFIRLSNLYSLLSILPTIAMLRRILNMHKS